MTLVLKERLAVIFDDVVVDVAWIKRVVVEVM